MPRAESPPSEEPEATGENGKHRYAAITLRKGVLINDISCEVFVIWIDSVTFCIVHRCSVAYGKLFICLMLVEIVILSLFC